MNTIFNTYTKNHIRIDFRHQCKNLLEQNLINNNFYKTIRENVNFVSTFIINQV